MTRRFSCVPVRVVDFRVGLFAYMQYQVPQFIDIEEKIVGPLTLRQFFYLAGAFIILFFFFFIFKLWFWVILAAIIGGGAAALAFVKYNGRPLRIMIKAIFGYFWRPRNYSWQTAKRPIGGKLGELELQLKTSTQPIPKREKGWLGRIFGGGKMEEKFEVLRKISGEKEVARRIDYR